MFKKILVLKTKHPPKKQQQNKTTTTKTKTTESASTPVLALGSLSQEGTAKQSVCSFFLFGVISAETTLCILGTKEMGGGGTSSSTQVFRPAKAGNTRLPQQTFKVVGTSQAQKQLVCFATCSLNSRGEHSYKDRVEEANC